MRTLKTQTVFLTGSPRSGTTILEELLNHHRDIAALYEPYYLWEKHFDVGENDVYDPERVTSAAADDIRGAYEMFGRLAGKPIILDKLPTHVFNIPAVRKVFPDSKWIHIYRDGRDVTLSICKEWSERKEQVQKKNFGNLLRIAGRMLGYQPYWRFRLKAILHELARIRSLNPTAYLNKSRWKGKVGWGPRFPGWVAYYESHSELEFSAKQWAECIAAVRRHWPEIPPANRLEIQYENLLAKPVETLATVLSFLGTTAGQGYYDTMPKLYVNNSRKWAEKFTTDQIKEIGPILSPCLCELGYEADAAWYQKA